MDYKKDIRAINHIIEQHKNDVSFNMFESDSSFSLIYKKTERIVTAMYLITNLFNDSEPLKWRIRSRGALLLSLILILKNIGVRNNYDGSEKVQNAIAEIISLFDVAHFSGIVSEMNFSILKREFINLINLITEYKENSFKDRVLFDPNFFAVNLNTEQKTVDSNKGQSVMDKGQIVELQKTQGSSPTQTVRVTTKDVQNNPVQNVSDTKISIQKPMSQSSQIEDILRADKESEIKKTNRRSLILNTIKRKGEVNIKDLASVIRSCSEKTIQRELAIMVEKNVLKKEGDRRWSKYSLID